MIKIRRVKALVVKEFFQIIRDPSSILIGVVMPIILLFLYGFGLSLDMENLPIGLVMEDTAPDAQSLAQSFRDSPFLDVKVSRHREDLVDSMVAGHISGFVVIPSYFSQFRMQQDQIAPIQVIADGSTPNTASFVQNYADGAWNQWKRVTAISDGIPPVALATLQPRFWYNEPLKSRDFLIPGSIAIIMTLIGTLLTALVVSREWERGTMEALMATPVRIRELIVGKLIPYYLFAMASMTFCTVVAILVYQIPFRGSILYLFIGTSIFLLSALGLGLLISTIARNQLAAAQAAQVVGFLPAFMLSGFIFEISSMPLATRLVATIIPARYYVSTLKTLFLVGDVWPLLLYNFLAMLLFGAVVFGVTVRISRKRLD
jgi:drug efflux transport system permease protein